MCDFVRMFVSLHLKDERKVKILQMVMLIIRYDENFETQSKTYSYLKIN